MRKLSSISEGIKVYTTLRDDLFLVAKDVYALRNVSKDIRKSHLNMLDDTMTLLIASVEMMIFRLGDILNLHREGSYAKFTTELQELDYEGKWLSVERDLRLCRNLRWSIREMDGIINRIGNRFSVRDPKELKDRLEKILQTETELAGFIASLLHDLANLASQIDNGQLSMAEAYDNIEDERKELNSLRRDLIKTQVEIIELI